MIRIAIMLISTFIVGCSMTPRMPHHEEQRLAKWNFRYRKDTGDEWVSFENIDTPFTGDCEDYAFTMQNQLGGKVHYTIHDEVGAHAVLIKNGVVYDNMKERPYYVKDFLGKIYHEMIFTGKVISN